jgi:hypothetical protein
MRNCVAAITFMVLGSPIALAAETVGRFPAPERANSAKTVAVVSPAVLMKPAALREVSGIPVIPLPKSLRPTRPPAGSPL